MQEYKQPMLLSDLWRRIAYRWKTAAVVFVLVLFATLTFGIVSNTNYSAKTVLTVNALTTNPFSSATVSQQINITTERAILSSGEVARRAAKNLGEESSAAALSENASIEAPQGSQVLTVTVVDSDPERAANKANALAAAYLDFRAEGAAKVADTYIKAIDKRIAALTESGKNGSSSELALSDLINQRNDLSLVAENPGRIIGFADPADTRAYPSLALYAVAGVAGGIVLGLIAAVVRDRFSRRTGNPTRLAESTDHPVLKIRDAEDLEGARWVVRSQIDSASDATGHAKAIGVLSLGQIPEAKIRALLMQVFESRGLQSHSQSAACVPTETLDRGWPSSSEQRAWEGMDVVLIGLSTGLEGTRIAMLGDSFLDSVIIVTDRKTPLAVVDRYLACFDRTDPESICLLFVEDMKNRSERPSNSDSWTPRVAEKADAIPVS